MKIYYPQISNRHDGFGTADRQIRSAMQGVGHPIVPTRDEADIVFNFCHPHQAQISDRLPSVTYFPWESSAPRDGWIKHLEMADRVLVTSEWMQETVRKWGFEADVLHHGINQGWNMVDREPVEKFRFLMVGFEALRKGGREALRAFNMAFKGRDDVELIIKTKAPGMGGSFFENVTFIDKDLPFEELQQLFYSCHALISPSYGEGFGMPGLDALATGMPVIHTAGFSPYADFIHPDLRIPSTLVDSPWPLTHPGKMFKPSVTDLADQMDLVVQEYDDYKWWTQDRQDSLRKKFDWGTLVDDATFALESDLVNNG